MLLNKATHFDFDNREGLRGENKVAGELVSASLKDLTKLSVFCFFLSLLRHIYWLFTNSIKLDWVRNNKEEKTKQKTLTHTKGEKETSR